MSASIGFVLDWFVTSNIIENFIVLYSLMIIQSDDSNSDFVTFFSKDIELKSIILDNSNLDDDNFDYCDPETINHVQLAGIVDLNSVKHVKRDK